MAETTLEQTDFEYETDDGAKQSVQFKTTVPKSLVEAMGWGGGDKLEWSVETGSKLSVEQAND